MADITKILPMGSSTQYTLGARYLTHNPNNTTTFLRGDNTFTNILTGTLELNNDLNLYTGSADSPDIVWWYANKGKELARIWMGNGGTSTFPPSYRCYNSSGTALYSGCLVLGNGTGASGTWGISITGSAGSVAWGNVTGKPSTFAPSSHTHNYAGSSSAGGAANSSNVLAVNNSANLNGCLLYMQPDKLTSGNDLPTNTWWHCIKMNHGTGDTYYKRNLCFNFWTPNDIKTACASGNGSLTGWYQVWCQGNSVTSAVWNDYAEYRESAINEPGYCLIETGNDTLIKSAKRLLPYAGISSDTWGFAEGETEKAKTPIAVAGRVLVYPYRDRNKYKSGQCVCTAPNGTVDIMHWWEIILFPDRIVGTVSCVPDYEIWGGGPDADRDPVKVNGRIWIKVR